MFTLKLTLVRHRRTIFAKIGRDVTAIFWSLRSCGTATFSNKYPQIYSILCQVDEPQPWLIFSNHTPPLRLNECLIWHSFIDGTFFLLHTEVELNLFKKYPPTISTTPPLSFLGVVSPDLICYRATWPFLKSNYPSHWLSSILCSGRPLYTILKFVCNMWNNNFAICNCSITNYKSTLVILMESIILVAPDYKT